MKDTLSHGQDWITWYRQIAQHRHTSAKLVLVAVAAAYALLLMMGGSCKAVL